MINIEKIKKEPYFENSSESDVTLEEHQLMENMRREDQTRKSMAKSTIPKQENKKRQEEGIKNILGIKSSTHSEKTENIKKLI